MSSQSLIFRAFRRGLPQTVRARLIEHPAGKRLIRWWNEQRADAYLLSYPKCGRTWLRLMMGRSIDRHFAIGATDPTRLLSLAAADPSIPRILVEHEDHPHYKRPEQLSRDKTQFASKRVVFLVRDPRDVLVSWYFHRVQRTKDYSGAITDFLYEPIGGLDAIVEYYNIWAQNRGTPQDFLLVRYEDLHRDTVGELARVMAFVGLPQISRDTLTEVADYARFDNMRKLEKRAELPTDRLRAADVNDASSFKTRRGKVHGFTDYFNADQIRYMNARIAERLSPYYTAYCAGLQP